MNRVGARYSCDAAFTFSDDIFEINALGAYIRDVSAHFKKTETDK